MTRKMIAYVTAGAIALTGMTATTAQAANDELFNFIAGATILAIVASGIQNNNNRTTVATTNNTHRPHRVQRHRRHAPKTCLRQRYTAHGWKKFYSHRCLAKSGFNGNHRHW